MRIFALGFGSMFLGKLRSRQTLRERRCEEKERVTRRPSNRREWHRAPSAADQLTVLLVSFGYKFGVPTDVDLVLDARFLANPFFVDEVSRLLAGEDWLDTRFGGEGRELLIVSEHNTYHIGELAILRQVMGTWPKGH